MKQRQRIKNDLATTDKRHMADKAKSDNRNRNDSLTQERRFEADKTMADNRTRNDEITANRREMKDARGPKGAFLVFVLILIVLAIGLFSFFSN